MTRPKSNRVYLLRHGRTEGNAAGRLQGRGDSPLLESSLPMIRRLADAIRPVQFDLFLKSPLARAETSFQLMLPLHLSQCRVEPALMEISFGDYNGQRLADLPAEFRQQRERDKWNTPWPGGESYQDIFNRLQPVVQEIKQTAGTIGILAHETVNKLLLASLLDWPQNRIFTLKQPNHVIYRIEDGNVSSLSVSNDWHSGLGFTEL